MTWAAESLHCVLFSQVSPGIPDALQPWLRTFGGNPQSFQQLPTQGGGGAHATGTVGNYQGTIVAQAGRLELILSSSSQSANAPPVIDDIRSAVTSLHHYIPQFAAGETPIRVAMLVNLSKRVVDETMAAREFGRETHLNDLPPGSRDLTFALNIPRPSPIQGVDINRICKWSTGVQQMLQFQIGVGGAAPGLVTQSFVVISLHLDLNTTPRQNPFTAQQTLQLCDHLVDESRALIVDAHGHLVS